MASPTGPHRKGSECHFLKFPCHTLAIFWKWCTRLIKSKRQVLQSQTQLVAGVYQAVWARTGRLFWHESLCWTDGMGVNNFCLCDNGRENLLLNIDESLMGLWTLWTMLLAYPLQFNNNHVSQVCMNDVVGVSSIKHTYLIWTMQARKIWESTGLTYYVKGIRNA